jgi:hypothetical protein
MIAGGTFDDSESNAKPSVFDDHFYKIVTMSAAVIIGLATTLYHWLEDWSWVDSLYFSVVAVTTVGFGDLVPTKDGTKLLTVAYVLAGIGIITTFINLRLQRNRYRRLIDRENKKKE